jgi:hypothetical protein
MAMDWEMMLKEPVISACSSSSSSSSNGRIAYSSSCRVYVTSLKGSGCQHVRQQQPESKLLVCN